MSLLDFLLCVVASLWALPCLYLGGLVLLSARIRLPSFKISPLRFDILVPSHNEEAGIVRTVENLLQQDWPRELFRIIVVADNCTDSTAPLAKNAGAVVWERRSETERGKGYALEFAFQKSLEEGFSNAVVVVDADSLLSKNALKAFAARIELGAMAIQAHYGVLEVHSTWRTRLMRIAFATFHGVRSLARERLGLSCGLRGNGMCFTSKLIREIPHRAHSVVEDLEYGILLGSAGHRVFYAADVEVLGEMTGNEKASRTQRQRWEGGRLALMKTFGLPLLWRGIRERKPLLMDLALDVLVPPLSWLVLGSTLGLALALLLSFLCGYWLDAVFVFGVGFFCLLVYVFRGWQLSGAGLRGLLDLACAPWFVFWKLALLLTGKNKPPQTWVRTQRETELAKPPPLPTDNSASIPPDDSAETPPGDSQETPPGGSQETPPGGSQETPPGDSQETPPGDSQEAPPDDSQEAPPGDAQETPPDDASSSSSPEDEVRPASELQGLWTPEEPFVALPPEELTRPVFSPAALPSEFRTRPAFTLSPLVAPGLVWTASEEKTQMDIPLFRPEAAAPLPSPAKLPSAFWHLVRWVLVAFGLILATALATVLGNGNPVLAVFPVLACVLGILLFRLPLRTSSLCLLFLMLVCDYLPEGPFEGLWASPLAPLARILFLNLSATTGIAPLRLTGLDAAVFLLLFVGIWRRAFRIEHLDPPGTPSVRQLNFLLVLQFVTVIALDLWGVYRGGDFNEALWQLRQMLLFPIMGFFFLHSIPGRTADFVLIARVLVAAACVKGLTGIYFKRFIAWPMGVNVEFTTSHSDTLLFVPVLVMAVALVFERPLLKTLWHLPLWVPIVALGMKYNDRRLAYVAMGASLFALVVMLPWSRIKRRVFQTAVLLAPMAALYVAAGWNVSHHDTNPLWSPARLVKSLIKGDPDQTGADYRDMENFNVLYTWSENAFVPLGFGHRFEEPIVLPDISFVMPTYQFHPHNTILWMWSIGGLFGFTAMFLPVIALVFLAARSYPLATHPIDKVAIFTALSFVITYLFQCWGDMGTRSYFSSMGLALALAVISKLAVRTGAWPAPRKHILP